MDAILTPLRVLIGTIWTGVCAGGLIAVVGVTYVAARIAALVAGRRVVERTLQWNVNAMGFVAHSLWAPVVLGVCGVHVRRSDSGSVDWSKTHVICANHASIFDIVAICKVLPPPYRFVAKRELLRWPLVGWVLIPAGQIVINRGDRGDAMRKLEDASVDNIHGQIIFFVEGTRSPDGKLLPFKKGAFRFALDYGVPILPVTICGSGGVLARVAWWRIHPGRDIDIRVDQPIDPPRSAGEEEVRRSVEDLMQRTRTVLLRELGQEDR